MKYTVTDVTTSHILVDFDNGKKALVPIQAGWDKERIEEEISKYVPSTPKVRESFANTASIPISVGDTNTIESYKVVRDNKIKAQQEEVFKKAEEDKKKVESQLVSYTAVRSAMYPSIGDQLDALYHAGVFPEEMASKIREVKEKYPKDMKQITAKELTELRTKSGSYVVIDGTPIPVQES
jgi:hypothetical protein